MKPTKTQIKSLIEFRSKGDIRIVSGWTTGSGSYTRYKTLPVFCSYIASDVWRIKQLNKKQKAYIIKHPGAKCFIAVTDIRGANKAIKTHEEERLRVFLES